MLQQLLLYHLSLLSVKEWVSEESCIACIVLNLRFAKAEEEKKEGGGEGRRRRRKEEEEGGGEGEAIYLHTQPLPLQPYMLSVCEGVWGRRGKLPVATSIIPLKNKYPTIASQN